MRLRPPRFTTVLLLIAAGAALLWVRSYRVWDDCRAGLARPWRWPARLYEIQLESNEGRLRLILLTYADDPAATGPDDRRDMRPVLWRWAPRPSSPYPLELDHGDENQRLRRMGFGYEPQTMVGPSGYFQWTTVLVPHWCLLALSAPLPLWRLARRFRRRRDRFRPGLCAACGYDLRAGHSRCPECGQTVRPGTAQTDT